VDVLFFLQQRTSFIRRYYDAAAAPFLETQRKIEAEEPPFVPPYSEDGEPPFLLEWLEAQMAIDVLGQNCVSLLAATLKLYFQTWEKLLGLTNQEQFKSEFKKGFVKGYRASFADVLAVDWATLPVDLDILEQVVLARNDAQHPGSIHTMAVSHGSAGGKARTVSLFVNPDEHALLGSDEMDSWLPLTIKVSRENLFKAIDAVDAYATWLEEPLLDKRFPGRLRARSSPSSAELGWLDDAGSS
jgi:hypothetical protein